jgi:hypothetical protein
VARLHLDDLVRAAGEFALRRRRGAPVLGAHHVRRRQIVPRRRPYGLLGHGQRLPDQKGRCVAGDVRRAVLGERLGEQFGPGAERTAVGVEVQPRSRGALYRGSAAWCGRHAATDADDSTSVAVRDPHEKVHQHAPLFRIEIVQEFLADLRFELFPMADTGSAAVLILALVLGQSILHPMMYGRLVALYSELFDTRSRYTGASLGYQFAVLQRQVTKPHAPCDTAHCAVDLAGHLPFIFATLDRCIGRGGWFSGLLDQVPCATGGTADMWVSP